MHRVGEGQAVDSLAAVGDQGLPAQDRAGEAVDDLHVLQVAPIGVDLDAAVLGLGKALGRGLAELDVRNLVLVEADFVVLADDLAHVAADLQAVGAGGVAGGGDEDAGRAVRVLQVGGDVVLDLDVVPLALVQEGAHAAGHAAEPLHKVELVRALVEQHAAALAVPGGAPGAGVIVVLRAVPIGDDPVDALELAQLPAVDHLLDLAVDAVCALVEHHAKDQIRVLVGLGVHLAHLLGVDACGLFAEHVQVVLEALDGERRVLVVRHRDEDGVHKAAGDQVAALREDGDRIAQLGLGPVAPLLTAVSHGRDLDLGQEPLLVVADVARAHVARADDAQTNFFHVPCLPT